MSCSQRKGLIIIMDRKNALQDLLVLDLTRVVSGPYCTAMMGDMGARIIKIELPKIGDDSRTAPPIVNNESAYYALLNRSKQGVTLNLKTPEGKKIFLDLAKKADVVVENYRPGVMDKLGLGYEELKKVNDRLIYGAITGFGSYGPYRMRPGYDIVAQGMGGLMSLTGIKGGRPTRSGNAMGDLLAGTNMVIGILAALYYRSLTGKGQMVDVSLVDSIVSSLENAVTRYWATGKLYERNGNAYPAVAPYDTFQTNDGDVIIGCGTNKMFENLCELVLKKPELVTDQRFSTNLGRIEHMVELKEYIEAWSKTKTTSEAVKILTAADIPTGPVYDISQVMADDHIAKAREMFPLMHHPIIGDMPIIGSPIKLMETMPHMTRPAPTLGQDNKEVYSELLGITEDEIEKLAEQNVI